MFDSLLWIFASWRIRLRLKLLEFVSRFIFFRYIHYYTLFLKCSKMDTAGMGVTISVSKINNFNCPYSSMVKYLKMRPRTPRKAPLFVLNNGHPMTKHWLRVHLVSVLTCCRLPSHFYTGHSFYIGAATTAAECNIPDSTIKTLGRR